MKKSVDWVVCLFGQSVGSFCPLADGMGFFLNDMIPRHDLWPRLFDLSGALLLAFIVAGLPELKIDGFVRAAPRLAPHATDINTTDAAGDWEDS